MQYTGLKDMHGVEIYEGDILHVARYPERGGMVVEWTDGVHYGEESGYHWSVGEASAGWERIGNIHENPELIPEE
ncbi:MAG: hypothetical protein JRC86_00355, partial [Deltaproteobacteria bacterium]|nr:hypothetical protein [Deltaproteobacteria bacterium]